MSSTRRFRREQARRAQRNNRPLCGVCGRRAAGWLVDVPLCIECRDELTEQLGAELLGAELSEEMGVGVTVELVDAARVAELIERGGCGHPGCMGITVDL
jgi:hypothetical protein